MTSLFRQELTNYLATLDRWLVEAAKNPERIEVVASLADAARSIRGAAKLLQVRPVAELAGDMEDLLRDLQKDQNALKPEQIEVLKRAVEALRQVLGTEDQYLTMPEKWTAERLQHVLDAHIALRSGKPQLPGETPPVLPSIAPAPSKPSPAAIAARKNVPALKLDEPASDQQLIGLFFIELEAQTGILTDGLLALEANTRDSEATQSLMRAAHSIKGLPEF